MSDFVLGLTHITDWEGYDHMLYLLALVAAYVCVTLARLR